MLCSYFKRLLAGTPAGGRVPGQIRDALAHPGLPGRPRPGILCAHDRGCTPILSLALRRLRP